ncbi:DUF3791 domain-containing protein [bacterium]|nr:DUF3791 domain-containing protein [bacterium]
MSEAGKFLIYCLERYRYRYGLSAAAVQTLFEKTGTDQYVLGNFEALHTVGEQYLLDDLHSFITNQA